MALFAAAARARLGELEGGELGAARLKAGHAWMLAQGVRNPAAMTRMLVPAAQVGVTAASPTRLSRLSPPLQKS